MNKLTAKTIRQNFPADVAEHVLGLSARFSTRSIYFSLRPEFYVDEDRNFLTYSDGQWRQIESAGEWHGIGAGRVTCNRDVRIPAGGWVIAWGYVLGKVSINVYHNNGQAQVA